MSQISNGMVEGVQSGELTDIERHRLLADERRRTVLSVLEERGTGMQLADLADAVAERESGEDDVDDELGRVAISLHHNHLPKLESFGVLAYDHDARRIDV